MARKLCGAHYQQQNTRGWLGPIRGSDEYYAAWFDEDGKKLCTRCGRRLHVEEFHKRTDSAAKNKWRSYCKKCNVVRRMGITAADYYNIIEAQGGGCAVCGTTEQENGRDLYIDHDHSCCPGMKSCGTCIRGVLCDPCNTAAGRLKDSPELAMKMADYLTNSACPIK